MGPRCPPGACSSGSDPSVFEDMQRKALEAGRPGEKRSQPRVSIQVRVPRPGPAPRPHGPFPRPPVTGHRTRAWRSLNTRPHTVTEVCVLLLQMLRAVSPRGQRPLLEAWPAPSASQPALDADTNPPPSTTGKILGQWVYYWWLKWIQIQLPSKPLQWGPLSLCPCSCVFPTWSEPQTTCGRTV